MTGSPLIALPPDPASPAGSTVVADGWWPNIDCNAARDALRIGEIVTQARLVAALEGAMLTITGDLAWWQAQLLAGTYDALTNPAGTAPAATLAAVTAAQLAPLHEPRDHHRMERYGFSTAAYGCAGFYRQRCLYHPAQAAQLASSFNGNPRLVTLFTRAVRCSAAAELMELYRDLGATRHSDLRAEAETTTSADYQRMAIQATRDMLGMTRVQCELI